MDDLKVIGKTEKNPWNTFSTDILMKFLQLCKDCTHEIKKNSLAKFHVWSTEKRDGSNNEKHTST